MSNNNKRVLVKYNYDFFDPSNIEDAKKIILTDESIHDQWETETEWTMKFFHEVNLFNEDSVVLDWGCGIGRLARPIIEEFNCRVVGVDFQPKMLEYAMEYVNHSNFTAIDNLKFSQLPDNYFTEGIAIWALQHTMDTKTIIKNIRKKLNFNGKFCVFDANMKSWPVLRVDPLQDTSDDVVINADISDELAEHMDTKKDLWVQYKTHNPRDLKNYFSVESMEPIITKNESNFNLSTFLDASWRGIFINNKK